MSKTIFIIAILGITIVPPITHAQESLDKGQQVAIGIGRALSTQERCAGHPLRSPEADRALHTRIVNAISRETRSTADNVRLALAAGAMQANFTPKPTKKDCREAEKFVKMAQDL